MLIIKNNLKIGDRMRIHSFKWFKKNCRFNEDGYYYKNEIGCMPLSCIDLCGKKVKKVGNRYKVPEGVRIKNDIVDKFVNEFRCLPEWFFEKDKEGMNIE